MAKTTDEKNGKAQTASDRQEITLRDVKKNAKNVKYLIEGLEDASKNSTAIRRAVTESKIIDLLKLEVGKMKDLAMKIALQDFEV